MTNTEYTRRVVKSLSYAQDVIHDALLDTMRESKILGIYLTDDAIRDASVRILNDLTNDYPHITIHGENFVMIPTKLLADDTTTLRVAA